MKQKGQHRLQIFNFFLGIDIKSSIELRENQVKLSNFAIPSTYSLFQKTHRLKKQM